MHRALKRPLAFRAVIPLGWSVMTTTGMSWLPWALASASFAALAAILAKIGIDGVDADLATFFRTCVVVLALGALLVMTGRPHVPADPSAHSYLFLALSGLATGASWLCYYRALSVGEAARVAPVDKLSVVLVAVAGWALLGEHVSPRAWIGVLLVGVGAVVVATG